LVINTEHATNETIKIVIEDTSSIEFKYKGEVVKEGVLKGIPITGAETNIALTVIRKEN